LLLNISEIVFMSLFSIVVQYWNRKSLNCCCRLGTFSQEKSCLIIFRHKYECILAEWARERGRIASTRSFAKWWRNVRYGNFLPSCILAFLLAGSARWWSLKMVREIWSFSEKLWE
jgi:hypothetical protein